MNEELIKETINICHHFAEKSITCTLTEDECLSYNQALITMRRYWRFSEMLYLKEIKKLEVQLEEEES